MMWLKKHWSTLLLLLILLAGVGLLGYPTFADWWNSFHQSRAIASYAEEVSQIDDADYEKMLKDAHAYNEKLLKRGDSRYLMTD
jgi:sortase A